MTDTGYLYKYFLEKSMEDKAGQKKAADKLCSQPKETKSNSKEGKKHE
jgi:hypothetical protein